MTARIASILINLTIFVSILIIVLRYFRQDGRWNQKKGLSAFRYFTCLSNVFCAVSAALMAISRIVGFVTPAIWLLKYLGTVTVAVTLMTVVLFLAPRSKNGYMALFAGDNLYMHLLGPLLAILSFCFLERGKMTVGTSLLGLIPVILYGLLYLYKILYAPEKKRWEDFYGFNAGGKWPVTYAAMVAGTVVICLILRVV